MNTTPDDNDKSLAGVLLVVTCLVAIACQVMTTIALMEIREASADVASIRRDIAFIRRTETRSSASLKSELSHWRGVVAAQADRLEEMDACAEEAP